MLRGKQVQDNPWGSGFSFHDKAGSYLCCPLIFKGQEEISRLGEATRCQVKLLQLVKVGQAP